MFSAPSNWVRVRVQLEYVNSSDSPRSWQLEAGRVELVMDGNAGTIVFPLVPETSGLVMPEETLVIEHQRPLGVATGPSPNACEFCYAGSSTWQLFVTVSTPEGSSIELDAGSDDLSCSM